MAAHAHNPTTDPATSPDKGMDRHWFAVYTASRHEKSVTRHFEQRSIEAYLPIYQTQHRWKDGSRALLELPLFPGYTFVHIPQTQRVRVLEVPGVVAFAGASGSQLSALPDLEIETLRSGIDPRRVQPCRPVAVGQHVRIRAGALAGLEGIVVRMKNSLRVVLTLDLLMQSIAVEVNGDELEPVRSLSSLKLETHRATSARPQRIASLDLQCLDSYPTPFRVEQPALHL